MPRIIGTVLLCAVALGLLAPARVGAAESVIRFAIHDEPESLDPYKTEGELEGRIQEDMFIGLTRYSPSGEIVPDLAERWDVSADGLTWTFHLRAGLKWSDGQTLTAQDFVWSLRHALDPKTAAAYTSALFPIKNAEAINTGREPDLTKLGVSAPEARTVVLTLNSPTAYLPGILALPIAYPVPRQAVEKFGETWVRPEHIVCSGAFKLAEWTPQDHVLVVRNPNFYDAGAVHLDQVRWLVIPDDETALRSFQNGEVDVSRVPYKRVPWAKKFMADTLHLAPILETDYIVANTQRPPLDDPRIRQAISLMIDRATIAEKVTPHGQVPAVALVPPGIKGYTPQAPEWAEWSTEQKTDKAKELLHAAGYGPEKRLSIPILFAIHDETKLALTAMTAMLKPVGIDFVPEPVEGQIFYGMGRHRDFSLMYEGWIADYPDPWTFLSNFRNDAGSLNVAAYHNPEFDALLSASTQPIDSEQRMKLLEQAERLILRDQAVIPLANNNVIRVISTKVHGYVDNPENRHRSSDLSLSP